MKKATEARDEIIARNREKDAQARQKVEKLVGDFTDGIARWEYSFTWNDFKEKFEEPFTAIQILQDLGYEVENHMPETIYSGILWWKKEHQTEGQVLIRVPTKRSK